MNLNYSLIIIGLLMFLNKSINCRSVEGTNETPEIDSEDLLEVKTVIKNTKKCAENFVLLNDDCYFISDDKTELDWYEANVKCESMGAELVQIKSKNEFDAIDSHLDNLSVGPPDSIWVAGIYSKSDEEFHWKNSGDLITFSKWAFDEPTKTFDHNCILLKRGKNTYFMGDYDCTENTQFICKSRPNGTKTTKICPEKFTLVGNKCIFVEENKLLDQFEARFGCLSIGAELSKVKNNVEMKALSNFLTKFDSRWIWIAGSDLRSEDNYYWDSINDEMTYTNWAPGQPDKTNGNEHCVHLMFHEDEYYMNDVNCFNKLAYICESTPKDPNDLNELVTETTTKQIKSVGTDEDCPKNFSKVGEKCYFVQNEQKSNWYNADRNCKRLKSDLATIESSVEMELLAKHMRDIGEAATTWSWFLNLFWTGANDLGSEGKFHWQSNGETVSYARWFPQEPNNAKDEEHCANLRFFDDGYYLNDEHCEDEMFYVCETNLLKTDVAKPNSELGVNTCSELELFKINLLAQTKIVNMVYSKLSCNQTLA